MTDTHFHQISIFMCLVYIYNCMHHIFACLMKLTWPLFVLQFIIYSSIAVLIQYNLFREYLYVGNMLRIYDQYVQEIESMRNGNSDYLTQLNQCKYLRI